MEKIDPSTLLVVAKDLFIKKMEKKEPVAPNPKVEYEFLADKFTEFFKRLASNISAIEVK